MSGYVGRLAPSPTGALHLGNARTFLIAWLRARLSNGRLILRMEDLDHPKVKRGAADEALADLRWLGLDWDEGPDIGGPSAPYVQTERLERYAAALETLKAKNLVYPCICSRADVEAGQSAPHAEEGLHYPGICRGRFDSFERAQAEISPGRLPAWRFRVDSPCVLSFDDAFCGHLEQDVAAASGDFVLARHAQGAGYVLACVVDDAAMGVSEVVRGDDLLPTTPRQLLVARALGVAEPRYFHAPLVVGENGMRLAKRHGDTRLGLFRERGDPPERVLGLLAYWSGWAELGEELSLAEIAERARHQPLKAERAVLTAEVKKRYGID